MESNLERLICLSNDLGDPGRDLVILGEGNTSARADADTFWVKASGTSLRTIDETGFVRVGFQPALALLDGPDLADEQIKRQLLQAKAAPGAGLGADGDLRPSVETVLHAVCLSLKDVNFVGHTHPTAINAVTCSTDFESAVGGRLFPDEIVVCGPAPVVVPYTDPGLPLARRARELIDQYVEEYNVPPRVVLMQNHGLIALGETPRQVDNITAMAVKVARVLIGTHALGGPRFLTEEDVARIHTRPDEHYRRRALTETSDV
jgi:rhamnose utilization protein RhaD (predicted bifunctional aldolase and dehydrogenase)